MPGAARWDLEVLLPGCRVIRGRSGSGTRRGAQYLAAHRTVQSFPSRGGAQPLHLPECEACSSRPFGVPGLPQRCSSVPSVARDPGPVPRVEHAASSDRQAHRVARARRRAARLPPRGVAIATGLCTIVAGNPATEGSAEGEDGKPVTYCGSAPAEPQPSHGVALVRAAAAGCRPGVADGILAAYGTKPGGGAGSLPAPVRALGIVHGEDGRGPGRAAHQLGIGTQPRTTT